MSTAIGTLPAEAAHAEPLRLLVHRAEPAADGILLIELRDPAGAVLPAFTPGAHVGVRVPSGAWRTYSLAGDPADTSRYLLAVRRDDKGRGGSVSLVDGVSPGDTILVTPPRNLFELSTTAPSYIFVAGGIGITPILSMIHWVQANGNRPFKLYYLTRSAAGTAFRAELGAAALGGQVVLHHDEGRPEDAFDLWPVFETPGRAHVYCCGPRLLMDAVRDMTGHWNANQIHFEDFGSDLVRPRDDDTPFTVRLARRGGTFAIPAGTTILEVLRAHGITAPSSCESGTCGTCRTGLLKGEADHRDLVLSPAERLVSLMICVSRARSPELVLDL